ncbi:MAG: DUF721 domain-containing protein [Bdellovibrionales bacterium]|nr:DUF721 domain-containing protein [Bdellovibrionales bacterium]
MDDERKLPRYRIPKRTRRFAQPQVVQNILRSALKRRGLDQKIARYEFVLHWSEIVGAEIAKRAHPERIRGNTLVVRVSNAAWAQELSFQKSIILRRLKRFLENEDIVRDIVFQTEK